MSGADEMGSEETELDEIAVGEGTMAACGRGMR